MNRVASSVRAMGWAAALVMAAWTASGGASASAQEARASSPKERVRLFDGVDFRTHCDTWLADDGRKDPRGVFTVARDVDGAPALKISGDGFGGLITKEPWRDYRLVVEYKWGDATYRDRTGKARDSGLLLHCQGRDGSVNADFKGPWKRSIEFQIIEGGTGDLLLVSGYNEKGELEHVSIESPSRKDRDGEPVYDPRGELTTYKSFARVNWFGRDEDWEDVAGFRGKKDVEAPHGEWTRCVVVAEGDRLEYFVNGVKVNEGRRASETEGQILLQTEGAELFVRRFELLPLGGSDAK